MWSKKPKMAESKETSITLTNSDIIGATARGLQEALAHLNQPSENVHGPAVVAHLERLMTMMQRIPPPIQAANTANGAQAEKRAN